MADYVKCGDCMKGAPYNWCCKTSCGKREACTVCESRARGTECPNDNKYFEDDQLSED